LCFGLDYQSPQPRRLVVLAPEEAAVGDRWMRGNGVRSVMFVGFNCQYWSGLKAIVSDFTGPCRKTTRPRPHTPIVYGMRGLSTLREGLVDAAHTCIPRCPNCPKRCERPGSEASSHSLTRVRLSVDPPALPPKNIWRLFFQTFLSKPLAIRCQTTPTLKNSWPLWGAGTRRRRC
jgi:hypothetical protein